MLQTLDEVRAVSIGSIGGGVENGIDDPNLSSVDSTTPLQTEVDRVENDDKEEKEEKEEKVEVKEKVEEKKEEKVKVLPEKDAVQKRIDEITRKRREAERDRDFERAKRRALEIELAKAKAVAPAVGKPNKIDFEDEDSYLEALADWKVEQKLSTWKEKEEQKEKETTEREVLNEADQALYDAIEQGKEKYEDFEAVAMAKGLPMSEMIARTILLSDMAPDVFYYLGQHPEELEEFVDMPQLRIAKKIGIIEVKLAAKKEEKEEEVQPPLEKKKLTKSPEPITPLKTTGVIEKDPANMSPKEYRAWREKRR